MPRTPILLTLAACVLGHAIVVVGQPDAARPAPRPLTLGRDTTWIEGPLKPNGEPDYLRWLNERASEGVTPQNNAAVELVRAFGLETYPAWFRTLVVEEIGLPVPVEGETLGSLDERVEALFAEAFDRGYEGIEHETDLIAWVAANESVLDRIVVGLDRERWYFPYTLPEGDTGVMQAVNPCLFMVRQTTRVLGFRAAFAAAEGRIEAAWRDIRAIHRLATHVSNDQTLLGALVAMSASDYASRLVHHLSDKRLNNEDLARAMAQECYSWAELTPSWEAVSGHERVATLEYAMTTLRDPVQTALSGENDLPAYIRARAARLTGPEIDREAILRGINRQYDEIVETLRSRPVRRAIVGANSWEADKEIRKNRIVDVAEPEAIEPWAVDLIVTVAAPDLSALLKLEATFKVKATMAPAALALTAFRIERGAYPDSLQRLVPEYLPAVPMDPFAADMVAGEVIERPIRYESWGSGCAVWSIGPDLQDDGGTDEDPREGDIIYRLGEDRPLP